MCAHLHLPAHYRHACAHAHQSPKVVGHNYFLPTPFLCLPVGLCKSVKSLSFHILDLVHTHDLAPAPNIWSSPGSL